MTDIEILCQSLEQYSCNIAKTLFGITSIPAQTLIRYSVRNIFSKYGTYMSVFTDKEGLLRMDLLEEAFKTELKERGGFSVMGIKFTDTDVKEIVDIYNRLKSNV